MNKWTIKVFMNEYSKAGLAIKLEKTKEQLAEDYLNSLDSGAWIEPIKIEGDSITIVSKLWHPQEWDGQKIKVTPSRRDNL